MWRAAQESDDDAIVAMCLALNEEDPGPAPVPAEYTRRTLALLREQPPRGRAVVLDLGEGPVGYALLIATWSNELGGEVCTVDELFMRPEHRGQGHGRELVRQVAEGQGLWAGRPVALELEVSPANPRARSLYERLGFTPRRNTTLRRLLRG